MAQELRFAIIGSGMMGQEHIRNLLLFDGNLVTAFYEPNDAMSQATLALVPTAVRCDSVEEAATRADVDCLLIASPNFRHVANLQAIAATGIAKPILCEKPLYSDQADRRTIEAIRKAYPAEIWVGMEYRYMAPVAALIEQAEAMTGGVTQLAIREHRFPFLEKVDDWNRFNDQSGGTFVEKCCHFFDLMRVIIGAEPTRLFASAAQDVNHRDEVYGGRRSDILDAGLVVVDFDNGARGLLELCMYAEGSRWQEEISAVGPNGKIECFMPGPLRLWPETAGEHPTPKLVISPRNPAGVSELEMPVDPTLATVGDHHGSTYVQHRFFREMVLSGGKPQVTVDDGIKAVVMGQAAQESAESGQVIAL